MYSKEVYHVEHMFEIRGIILRRYVLEHYALSYCLEQYIDEDKTVPISFCLLDTTEIKNFKFSGMVSKHYSFYKVYMKNYTFSMLMELYSPSSAQYNRCSLRIGFSYLKGILASFETSPQFILMLSLVFHQ